MGWLQCVLCIQGHRQRILGRNHRGTAQLRITVMVADAINLPLLVVFALSLVVLLAATAIGHGLGVRAARRNSENSAATLEGAILGLLALLIAFTFSMSLSHFEARRDAVLQEANAIGTTVLRARLLPAPYATESLQLLREYLQIRLDLTRYSPTYGEAASAIAQSNAIQEKLWQQVTALAATNTGMVPTGLYIVTLNEMIDDQEKRLTAIRNRIPAVVIWSLYGVAIIAVGFTGYGMGLEKQRYRLPVYIVSILLAAVLLLIQDLDRPGAGFIRVSQQPMLDTAASVTGHSE
jgi:hypothetical protein